MAIEAGRKRVARMARMAAGVGPRECSPNFTAA